MSVYKGPPGAECQQVAHLLAEYFVTGDLAEAAAELEDMAEPELQHFLVKRAVATALDKHNREREMTSVLLSSLYSEVSGRRRHSCCEWSYRMLHYSCSIF